jgi:hypothetical protein
MSWLVLPEPVSAERQGYSGIHRHSIDFQIKAETHVQDRLPRQGRVDAVEVLAWQQEIVATEIPGHATFIILDGAVIRSGEEAMLGFLKIPLIGEGQNLSLVLLGLDCAR